MKCKTSFCETCYQETKDDGARKLKLHTLHHYKGLSHSVIQTNDCQEATPKDKVTFQNNAPLRPIKVCRVQARHQVDLMSMVSMPATIDGDT